MALSGEGYGPLVDCEHCNEPSGSKVQLLVKLNATVTSYLLAAIAGTALFTTKHYKMFPLQIKYCFIKTLKSSYVYFNSFFQEPGSDYYVQLY
jgi:hypothetical protein